MQRILYVTDSLMAGGVEHQLVELVTRLDRQRFEPFVVCLYGERAGRSLHFMETLRRQNIPVFVLDLDWSRRDKLIGLVMLMRLVWRIRPHIVQAVNYHSNLLMCLARPALPGSLKLIRCVYMVYTPKQLLYDRLSRWLCSAVVCNSPQILRQLNANRLACRMVMIPNGIDLERFVCHPDAELRARAAPQARRVLLFMGRMAEVKALPSVVQALGILKERKGLPPGVAFWIVGEFEDETVQVEINRLVEYFDLFDVVFQFPPTQTPEAYYAAADVTVLVSRSEGLPNAVLELLAAGRPVIVSDAANASGVIQPGVTGWVVPAGDVSQLADTLSMVLVMSDAELGAMRPACQRAAAPFAVENMVRCFEALYCSLMARS